MSLSSAQARLESYQEKITETAEDLGQAKADGKSADGQVKVGLTADFKLRRVKIAPELLEAEDTKALEKAVGEAISDALAKAQRIVADRLAEVSV